MTDATTPQPQPQPEPQPEPQPAEPEQLDLEAFINTHLVRGKKSFHYTTAQLERLTELAVYSFNQQETLIEVQGPIQVCGDIHGQYSDLLRIFKYCGSPLNSRYLFLGDYVDRGRHSMEVICLLLACKVQFPDNFFLLRGNHELAHINRLYGFYEELGRRCGAKGDEIWNRFNDVFSYMPLAATIGNKILCMHGGISPHLNSLDDIRKLNRPIPVVIDAGLAQDLLWADPNTQNPQMLGFAKNEYRNCSVFFGKDELTKRMNLLNITLILRAHQVVQYGFRPYGGNRMVTIFSAPRYHQEMTNWGAVAKVDAELKVSYVVFKPKEYIDPDQQQQQQDDAEVKQVSC